MNASPEASVRHLYDSLNEQDADAAAACYAVDALNHGRPEGREGMRRTFESVLATFPDVRFESVAVTTEGRRVACRLRMYGTHPTGEWPPPAAARKHGLAPFELLRQENAIAVPLAFSPLR